jgi:hypothetical protein
MSETSVTEQQDAAKATASIIVNGQKKSVPSRIVSFDEVVKLAFPEAAPNPDITYTVTYRNADEPKHDGSLVEGETVKVKEEGTVFSVTRTTKS